MPRVTKKKKPLRGSIRQNRVSEGEEPGRPPWFGFSARLALLVLAAIAFIVFVSWLWHSAWPRQQVHAIETAAIHATQKTGFAVSDVMVEGRHYTDKNDLFAALGVTAGSPIFTFDPEKAYDAIMQLPWTESVVVVRSLPNKILIKLAERQPMARWQHDDKTVVIDAEGKDLTAAKPEQFANLPLVVGTAAPEQTKALLTQLRDFPVVARVLKAAVRVGERRWNFYVQPNLLIRLPERNEAAALKKLTELIQDQKILDRNVVAIDLRLPDRMVVEPGKQPDSPQLGDTKE